MALRRKVLLIVGGSLAGLIVVLYLVSRALILNSYLNLEDQDVRRNVQRVLNALQSETTSLSATASDWAYWNETYTFVQTGDQSYITSNINEGMFTGLSLNTMILLNNEREVVFRTTYDSLNNQFIDVPAAFETYISADSPLLADADQDESTGVVMVGDVPMLIVSRAVLQDGQRGPLAGTLIFTRALDDAKIAQIGQSTQLSLALRRLDDPALPDDFQTARAALSATQSVVVQPSDNDIVNGYTILNDINGVPALYLRVQLPREIYAQGQNSLSTLILGVLLVGVVMIAVTLVLIERLVLVRLVDLSREMETITASGNPSARLNISGDDELALLGSDINKMLAAIEQAQLTVRQNEERLQKSLNALEQSQDELVNNDYQLQMTVSRLEKQKRQLQRMSEFVRSTAAQMESSLQRGASTEELMDYLRTVQVQLARLESDMTVRE